MYDRTPPGPSRGLKIVYDILQALDGNWMETVAQLSGASALPSEWLRAVRTTQRSHARRPMPNFFYAFILALLAQCWPCAWRLPQCLCESHQQRTSAPPRPSRTSTAVQTASLHSDKCSTGSLQVHLSCTLASTSFCENALPIRFHQPQVAAGTKNVKLMGTDPEGNKYYQDITRP